MKKIKQIILSVLGVVTLLSSANAVFADTVSQSMTVSPTTQRMILTPGESYTNAIKVANANSSTRDLKYKVSVGSFSQSGKEGGKDDYETVDHISVSNYNQIMEWISFDKTSGSVAPNETDVVQYTINVPKNAPAGGQYATIIVKDVTDEESGASDGNVMIQSSYQFASIIYAEVAGETKEDGEVLENSIPSFIFTAPLTVSSMVENSGNVHTDAKYTLQIWSLFSDEELYTNEEEPKKSLILPDSKRYNTQTWDETPAFGIFKVKQTVEIFGDVSTVEKIVVICPLWLLLLLVIAIVAIIVWIIFRVKARNNRE